jgi:hypothetical protein
MEKRTANGNVTLKESGKGRGALVIVAIVLVLASAFYLYPRLTDGNTQASAAGAVVASARSYVGRVEHATTVVPDFTDGRASLSLSDVDRLNIVDFQWENLKGDPVAVMAYITSSGHLFVGNSQCGCGGDKFFLAGEVLVCNACRTTFTIEDQEFLSGSTTAGKTPPGRIKSAVEDGMIVIDQADLGD